jgi:type I restriction enzyme S subunit
MKTAVLGEIVECLDRLRVPVTESDRVPGDVPYYGANGQQGWIDRAIFNEPLVIVAEDGGHFDNPSRGVAYRIDGPAWVNNHGHVLRAKPGVHADYLFHALRNYNFAPYISGSTRSKLTQKQLLAAEIPLPSLDEQRRIAAILDQADALRAKRRQSLAHLDDLSQSIFIEMFGDLTWSGTLGALADVQIGPFGSLLHQEDYVSGGVPVLNPMHIRGGRLEADPEFSVSEAQAASLALYKIRTGDVVLGRRGEMGRAGVAGPEHDGMLCGTGSVVLRPKHVDSVFLHSVVTSARMRAYLEQSSLGATLPNLNAGIVKAAPAPKAASHAQAAFADRLRARDHLLGHVQRATARDDALITSLQSRAFRGEL